MKRHFSTQRNKAARYFLLTGIVFLSTALPLQAQNRVKDIDSLEMRLNAYSLSDNELFFIYEDLTDAYIYTNIDNSLKYARLGIRLAEKKNNPYQIAKFYFYLANALFYSSQPDSALHYYEQSFDMLKLIGENEWKHKKDIDNLQLKLFYSVGVINHSSGKYDLALDYYFKALEMTEKINETDATTVEIYYWIATTYFVMMNDKQAEIYFLKAEKLAGELNDSISLAQAYQGLCGIYVRKKDYNTALKYGEECLRILSASPDAPVDKLMDANQFLSDVWLKLSNCDKALVYAQDAVEYARQTNIPMFMANALYILSNCYLKQGKYRESEKIAFQALETNTTDVYVNSCLYWNIAENNTRMGNHEKGIEYFEKTINNIRDFSNKNFQASISEMEVKYETEKKEMQIAALKEEKCLVIWLSVAGGGLLLSALAALFFLWRWTVQKQRLAESHIKQLEQEKLLIATQAVFDGEVRERTRLARDLHDGMGGKLTAMKLHLDKLKRNAKFDYDDLKQVNIAMDMLDDSVQEMRRVSHNLMPDTLSRSGLIPAVDDFCRSMSSQIVFNHYGDESRLDLKLEVLIYQSICELVNNAMKYAGASEIMVQIVQEAAGIAFIVQDNGCGFDPSAETKGMGLQNIRTRVASMGGDILIDSNAGEGTEVNVELRIENYGNK